MADSFERVAASGTVPALKRVEACIAWAAQHGYGSAISAAAELGVMTGRVMWEDQPYYSAYAWRDETAEEHDERQAALAEAHAASHEN